MINKFLKWAQEMYPQKQPLEIIEHLEYLVKCDLYGKPGFKPPSDSFFENIAKHMAAYCQVPVDIARGNLRKQTERGSQIDFIIDKQPDVHKIDVDATFDKQPKFKPGDHVRVTERVYGYSKAFGWTGLTQFMHETFVISRISKHQELSDKCGEPLYSLDNNFHIWPEGSLEFADDYIPF